MTTPQRLSDRYELGEIIGLGGMAEVHVARDLRLHRDVAVKVLRADLARDPNFYQRFKREAKNAAALNHPAIVAVHDTGETDSPAGPVPYIVMEYVDGVTLRDVIRTDGPIPPRRAIEIIADACQALHFSHRNGIIHRDVKPANIMISESGAVKVMDFGIARAIADAGHSLTQTAAVIGTAQYLSPEQAHGDTVDARSDVYSLGCVLYEMLTGEPPFTGDTPLSVAYQHVRKAPAPPSARRPGISPALDAVVLKALAKKPERRYQSAAELRTDLVRVHGGEAPLAASSAAPGGGDADPAASFDPTPHLGTSDGTAPLPAFATGPAPRRLDRNRRWIAIGAVAVTLAIVATIGITSLLGRERVPDVNGKTQAEAVALLRDRGFTARIERQPNSTTASEHVIDTDPKANASAGNGSDVTVHVSTGAARKPIPDVKGQSADDARRTLAAAGFEKVSQISGASSVEQKDRVTTTRPPIDSTQALSDEVTIVVGSGPNDAQVPDVKGRSPDEAKTILTAAGFTKLVDVRVSGFEPFDQVVGTNPPAGQQTSVDAVVQVQESLKDQFQMPPVVGQTWEEVQGRLGALGWRAGLDHLDRGPDVPGPDASKNKVVTQSPPPGTGVGFDDKITLGFGS